MDIKFRTRREQMEFQAHRFHYEHPEVWELFVKFTFDRIRIGFQHYAAKGIWERIRWETDRPDYVLGKEFKLGNNHTAFYARWFMQKYPQHEGFFRTRRQISEDKMPTDFDPLPPTYFDPTMEINQYE